MKKLVDKQIGLVNFVAYEETDEALDDRYRRALVSVHRVRALLVPGELISRELVIGIQEMVGAFVGVLRDIEMERADEILLVAETFEAARSEEARGKAAAKHAKDPKRLAKAGALLLWHERREGRHPRLATVEQFALEVMRRWPILKSAKVICSWSAKWTRDVREGRNPAC